jgi:putative nucleotidyltransferase with HDIG domain
LGSELLTNTVGDQFDTHRQLGFSNQIFSWTKAKIWRKHSEEIISCIGESYSDISYSKGNTLHLMDRWINSHSGRVASLALLLAKEIGLDTYMLRTIATASLLHDLGKARIDENVLMKKGRLTNEEFDQIKLHPELGVELQPVKESPWNIEPIILYHHEKMDGTGYPLGLRGKEIPLGGRIVSIADVFDALTSDRAYRKANDPKEALEIMEEAMKGSFDCSLFKCFINMIN